MQLTGDFAGLRKFEAKLRAAKDAYDALPKVLSEQAVKLAMMGFRKSTDPYGAPWKGTHRGGRILRKSGAMSRSVFRKSGPNHFTVGFGTEYASTHQNGATIRAKNAHRVDFERKNPRRRTWKKGKGRSGSFVAGWSRRKGKWSSAGRSGGQSYSNTHHVSWMRTALVFKIGKQWTSKQSVKIPQRMMVPSAGRGLPHTWSTAFQRTVNQKLKRHFR